VAGKLIRDKILADGPATGTIRVAGNSEMRGLLLAKLEEEVAEVRAASTTQGVMEELGDVLEVLFTLAAWHGYDQADLDHVARMKTEERGGFLLRRVWSPE
jgi:predicted house-cleaning noncanonical NTP pyrophosphatase (MazG superfamily)